MFRKSLTVTGLLAVLAVCLTHTAEAASRLDADTMAAALRTAEPNEVAYITYVVTLLDQGRLSRDMVEGTFQWARRKPYYHKKFQYFKYALITQADKIGITLPQGTPDLTPGIEGQVVLRVLLVDLPCANITVRIRGTKRDALTDASGRFTLENVPYGTYILEATGIAALLPRKGTAKVTLPAPPPSDQAPFVRIRLR